MGIVPTAIYQFLFNNSSIMSSLLQTSVAKYNYSNEMNIEIDFFPLLINKGFLVHIWYSVQDVFNNERAEVPATRARLN